MSRIALAFVLLFMSVVAAAAERPRPLGWAMDALRSGNWDSAATIAARDGDVAADIIEWHRLRASRGSYEDIASFLDRRPDWPGEALLRERSEETVADEPDTVILSFFEEMGPQTPEGILAHAAALTRAGREGEADANLVLAWRTLPMKGSTHARYLSNHGDLLKPHHAARLDALLWSRDLTSAGRMFDLVSNGQRALAEARIGLRALASNVDALIDAVPNALQDDPGLARDRFEWRVRKGRWDDAKALLMDRSRSVEALGQPEDWANRRRALARDEMRDGDAARAYQLAARHFLTEGSAYADLEWLSGYIALRKLQDPEVALGHFQNHRNATRSPISRGRAGYWIGRAHEAMGNTEEASAAYAEGAQYQTSFYGLLAAERGALPIDPFLDGSEAFSPGQDTPLTENDLYEAGLLLQASGEVSLAERFWTHLAESLDRNTAGYLGHVAIAAGQPHIAVMIGKRVARRGITLHAPYYPLHPLADADLPMAPEMNLAIARRESEFDPVVQSSAGALGLMQVMPGTGRDVASDLGLSADHTTARLISDPPYNARLGATYLSQLARRFDGNVILMSAAYNAGPSRPDQWMLRLGDPRRGTDDFDAIDWIEHIPFRETRNYVMRVTESLPIYRARLGKDPLPIPFSEELVGSTLLSFAPQGE
ncbi:lytic transglycosylase domain-containing protein [Tateyamaria omphalii]|uniref:lytic transglycosylase domain-containing protein n=1 Tax=Tateyamaria omphalii TaxID=299262 RepID=UPI001C98FD04|nr:lytic transglycosylase domain-containing protein [Tateyamaria omphalii]MBY5935364.1 lytic transglycosylase domain-containing protein [Tateyamaria omphalii]